MNAGKQQQVSAEAHTSPKQTGENQSTRFIDSRAEAVTQRRLQDAADNSQQIQQLGTIQTFMNASPLKNNVVAQLKPADFNRKHTLSVDALGVPTNAEAARADVPVSYPMNTLVHHKLTGVTEDLVGGHLFKREYGGEDDFSNVVTWNSGAESNFTTYENAYLADAVTAATGPSAKGAHNREIKTEAKFSANKINVNRILTDATDQSAEAKEARHKLSKLLTGGIESIPDKVKVTAQGRVPWEKNGKGEFVKGDLVPVTKKVDELYDSLKAGDDVDRMDRALEKIDEM